MRIVKPAIRFEDEDLQVIARIGNAAVMYPTGKDVEQFVRDAVDALLSDYYERDRDRRDAARYFGS